jgi:hypothetical protein
MKKLKIICSILLAIALLNNPYGYYQILKWVVTISSSYIASGYFKSNKEKLGWIFVSVAILYNPIIPIFLDRSTWEIVNVITIGLMLFSYKK